MTTDRNEWPKCVLGIQPGCAVVFYRDADRRREMEHGIDDGTWMLCRSHEVFGIQIQWERTDDERLLNRIVARRVNVGCADCYAIIVGDSTNPRPFLERYFDLTDATSEEFVLVTFPKDTAPGTGKFCLCEGQARSQSRDEEEVARIEKETQIFLKEVARLIRDYVSKTHRMPPMAEIERIAGGNLSFEKERPSELVVDRDLRIILPSYGNLEFPLPPLPKALYFLFLLHPEGVRLAELANHRAELEDLYSLIVPNRDEALASRSLAMLTDPLATDSLRQQISRIKRIVTTKILNPSIAGQYYISGDRGQEYRIPLSPRLIHLPKALLMSSPSSAVRW